MVRIKQRCGQVQHRFDLSDLGKCSVSCDEVEEKWERMDVSAGILWRFMAKI